MSEELVKPTEEKKAFQPRSRGRGRRQGGRREPKEFEEVVLDIARVTRVVKGGRRMRFLASVAIGNKKGKVGLGTGKSVEVSVAIRKAVQDAKKAQDDIDALNASSLKYFAQDEEPNTDDTSPGDTWWDTNDSKLYRCVADVDGSNKQWMEV